MTADVIGNGNDDGTNFGRSDDKIGFYGLTTPIVKATVTLGAGTTTTLLKADVLALQTALVNLGLITAG
jgi:hypothetical protein